MREGTDVSLIGFGKLVGYNLRAAEILEKEGISCEVRSPPAPLPAPRGVTSQAGSQS